jgi:hypothetical protein
MKEKEDDLEEITCSQCDNPIYAKGLCRKHYRVGHRDPEKQRQCVIKWRVNHPDYWKKYYQRKKEEKKE